MRRCKRDGCREPADPRMRKQYCTKHGNEYLTKQREAQKRRDAAPRCSVCGTEPLIGEYRLSVQACSSCETTMNENLAQDRKRSAFHNAETVEDLKEWFYEYHSDLI